MKRTILYAAAVCVALPAFLSSSVAQQPTITRTAISTADFPPGYETVVAIGQVPAGVCFDRHTHFGMENVYLLEGELIVKIDGRPDQHLKPGQASQIPAGVPHSGCSIGAVKTLAVFVVEKGKPLATPAP